MTIGRYAGRRDEPFFWWGTPRSPDKVPTLQELIAGQLIRRTDAALALLLLQRGVSLIVLSEASGAGKSSLLHALLQATDLDRSPINLRGGYETFDFLESAPPDRSILLVNEISPHLPAYLWGRPVHQLFLAKQAGYQIAATAHASSPAAFVHAMTSTPLAVPAELVMTTLAFIELPGGAVTGVRPGVRPGTAIVEPFAERTSIDSATETATQWLDATGQPSVDVGQALAGLLELIN